MSSKWEKSDLLSIDLYGITASQYSLGRSNLMVVEAMLMAGIKVIQYREKDKTMKEKYEECVAIRKLTERYQACFIVNDDIHLALAVSADGIHLGQDDLPIEAARKLVGENMLIGLSTHSPKQAMDAVRQKVDYIGVGPIYQTFTKKDVVEPVGLEYLDYVVKSIPLPAVAIGGIKENNIDQVISCGAKMAALVTEFVGAEDIQSKVMKVRTVIARTKEKSLKRVNE